MNTYPGNVCRLDSDSSYVRNDTSIVFFTESIHNYRYNSDLYNPDGVYLTFKLEKKGRERLGWLKFSTTGTTALVSSCAIQE